MIYGWSVVSVRQEVGQSHRFTSYVSSHSEVWVPSKVPSLKPCVWSPEQVLSMLESSNQIDSLMLNFQVESKCMVYVRNLP